MHELLIKTHDTLHSLMSKQVDNSAHILGHLFDSVSRQHCEVWASRFQFLYSLKDMVPPSEACLYGHINCSLIQAQKQSSMGLSQSLPPMRCGKAGPRTAFYFNVQKRPVPESSGVSLVKMPHLESRIEAQWVVESLLVVVSLPVLLILGEGEPWGIPLLQSTASSSSSVMMVGMFSHFLDQWRIITTNRFVFNMVQDCHLQLRSCSPLFSNFQWVQY